jgi:hypothetical protein
MFGAIAGRTIARVRWVVVACALSAAASVPVGAQVAPPLRVPPKDSIAVPVILPVPPLRTVMEDDGAADPRVRTSDRAGAANGRSRSGASALAISITREGERVRVRVPVDERAAGELSEPFFLRDRVRLYMTVGGTAVVASPAIDPVGESGLLAVTAQPVGDRMQVIVEAASIRKYGMESDPAGVTLWLEPDAGPHGRTPSLPLPTDAVVEAARRASDANASGVAVAESGDHTGASPDDVSANDVFPADTNAEGATDGTDTRDQADAASSIEPKRGNGSSGNAWTVIVTALSKAASVTRAGAVRTGSFFAAKWTDSAPVRAALAERTAGLVARAQPAFARTDVRVATGLLLVVLAFALRIRHVRRRRVLEQTPGIGEQGTGNRNGASRDRTIAADPANMLVMASAVANSGFAVSPAPANPPAATRKGSRLKLRRKRAAESSNDAHARAYGSDPRLWAARTLAGEGLDALSIARRTGLAREATALIVMDARRKVPAAAGTSRASRLRGSRSGGGSDAVMH